MYLARIFVTSWFHSAMKQCDASRVDWQALPPPNRRRMACGMNVSRMEMKGFVQSHLIIDEWIHWPSIPDAIKTFRNVIDNVPTEVEVLDRSPNGSYFVNLFVNQDIFVCVNDFLLYHKIAIPIDDSNVLKVRNGARRSLMIEFGTVFSRKNSIRPRANLYWRLSMSSIFKAS